MPKILVLFTGGTVGCKASGGEIGLDGEDRFKLLELYTNRYGKDDVEFIPLSPFFMLSETLSGLKIQQLCESVENSIAKYCEEIAGIIVTHGSDTLQYSGAALALYLGKVKVPVILVASNYVLEDERANGLSNFRGAVLGICNKILPCVYIAYKNAEEPVNLHIATRCLPHGHLDDRLYSLVGIRYSYEEDVEHWNSFSDAGEEIANVTLSLPEKEHSPVMWCPIYPGVVYPKELDEMSAVLLSTYHSGTLTGGAELTRFLSMAKEMEVPVFLCGNGIEESYTSVKEWDDGVCILPVSSPIAIYMKLWLLTETYQQNMLLQKKETLQDYLKHKILENIAEEFV